IESDDFAGKTIIPFATSGSSSISNAGKELQETYPGLKWQKGRLLNDATKEDIKKWTKK
ncbi:flavodoxin, partial [Bacteroides congonensis]